MSSVDNVLRLLLWVGGRDVIRVTDASKELGLGLSTAHRLLTALETRGFVGHDARTRTYFPGPSLSSLAMSVFRELRLQELLRPIMQRVVAESGETVALMTLRQDQIQFIEVLESPRALRTSFTIGSTAPAHCTAGGKVMLSRLADDEVMQIFPEEDLPALTRRSVTSRTALLAELAAIRDTGYAVAREEGERGVCGIGVPLLSSSLNDDYALTITGPTRRVNGVNVHRLATLLQEAATEAGRCL